MTTNNTLSNQPTRTSDDSNPAHYAPEELVGTVMAGERYNLNSLCGEGSMAFVYKAWDNRLETDVIVKIPKPEKIADAAFRARFSQERKLLVQLSHPHIVRILDMGDQGALPFIVMQYLPGGDLKERLKSLQEKGGQMAPGSLRKWMREVARALDFVASQGMVHRDVKPANILFDEHSNPFLSDFGLTKIMLGEHRDTDSEMTAAGFVVGTPNYVAPELVLGEDYDGRADQYAMGIIAYHMMVGEPPMQGASSAATMVNQTRRVLPLLSDVRPDFPRRAALAVQKAIDKNPANRFRTSEEFAEAVISSLSGGPGLSSGSHRQINGKRAVNRPIPPRAASRSAVRRASANRSNSSTVSQGDSLQEQVSRGEKGLVKCPACRVPLPLRPIHSGRRGSCIHCQAYLKVSKDLTKLWLLNRSSGSNSGKSGAEEMVIGEKLFGWTLPKKIAAAVSALLLLVILAVTVFLTVFVTQETPEDQLRDRVEDIRAVE